MSKPVSDIPQPTQSTAADLIADRFGLNKSADARNFLNDIGIAANKAAKGKTELDNNQVELVGKLKELYSEMYGKSGDKFIERLEQQAAKRHLEGNAATAYVANDLVKKMRSNLQDTFMIGPKDASVEQRGEMAFAFLSTKVETFSRVNPEINSVSKIVAAANTGENIVAQRLVDMAYQQAGVSADNKYEVEKLILQHDGANSEHINPATREVNIADLITPEELQKMQNDMRERAALLGAQSSTFTQGSGLPRDFQKLIQANFQKMTSFIANNVDKVDLTNSAALDKLLDRAEAFSKDPCASLNDIKQEPAQNNELDEDCSVSPEQIEEMFSMETIQKALRGAEICDSNAGACEAENKQELQAIKLK